MLVVSNLLWWFLQMPFILMMHREFGGGIQVLLDGCQQTSIQKCVGFTLSTCESAWAVWREEMGEGALFPWPEKLGE